MSHCEKFTCRTPTPKQADWEEEFDERFDDEFKGYSLPVDIKAFIRQTLTKAREEERERLRKEVEALPNVEVERKTDIGETDIKFELRAKFTKDILIILNQ